MNKEFSRMQKLAGLITENMEVKDLKSITDDTINHFIKISSSAKDREKYIEDQHGLTDAGDIETVMNNVSAALRADAGDPMDEGVAPYEYEMGKGAGDKNNFRDAATLANAVVGKHGQELKSSKDLSPREFESKALMYASKMMKEAGMEKVVMTNLFIDEDWPSDYISEVSRLLREMSGKEMGMEEGLNRQIHEMKLRDKIREMILAEMGGDIAEAKKDDEEEDVDVTTDVDITDDEMMGNNDPNVTEIQDLLIQLQKAAKELGDEKLLTQVDNTITFFTREHIATADNME